MIPAIVGLTTGFSVLLPGVAVIALGAAPLFEGAAISVRYYKLLSETTQDRFTMAKLGIDTTAESPAGVFAITLGILAVLQLRPMVLVSAAITIVGRCRILGAGANARLNALRVAKTEEHPLAEELTREAVVAAAGFQMLVGLGGIVLGILALSKVDPMILNLVAILGISFSILLSGAALSSRMLSVVKT